jgi:hypothetical protein
VTIQGNGTVKTILVIKHLRTEVKILEMLLCYNYQNGITNEEDIIFVIEPNFFFIGTISLPTTFQYVGTIESNHKSIKVKNHSTKLSSTKFVSVEGDTKNRYELVYHVKKKCITNQNQGMFKWMKLQQRSRLKSCKYLARH